MTGDGGEEDLFLITTQSAVDDLFSICYSFSFVDENFPHSSSHSLIYLFSPYLILSIYLEKRLDLLFRERRNYEQVCWSE